MNKKTEDKSIFNFYRIGISVILRPKGWNPFVSQKQSLIGLSCFLWTFLFPLIVSFFLSSYAFGELKIYYGGLHSHTSLSDGALMPEDAYKQAINFGEADFWAVTDHAGSLESLKDNEKLKNYLYGMNISDSDIKFKITKIQAEQQTNKDKFVAIRGFENSGSEGHINVFNTDTFYRRQSGSKLIDFYNWLRQYPLAVAMFNHPQPQENFHNFEYYEDLDPIINCVEVINSVALSYEPFISQYFMALDAGWHLGPTATEDNHSDDWAKTENRTAVFAENLTEENILDALRKHHFYATPDKNLQVYFYGNDSLMGSKITADKVNFEIKVIEPDGNKIDRVTLYTNEGKVVKFWTVWKNNFETEYTVDLRKQLITPSSQLKNYYFVLEVSLMNFTKAVTSPIWVNLP